METLLTQPKSSRKRLSRTLILAAMLLGVFAGFRSQAQTYLTEGFEGSTFPPTGWTRAITSGSYNWQQLGNSSTSVPNNIAPHGGNYDAWFQNWYASSGSTAELRTPALNFTGSNAVQVSFWFYRNNTYSYTDYIEVYVNTTSTSTGGTLISPTGGLHSYYTNSPAVATAGWYKYTFNVPATYNGTTNYIIFKAVSAYGPDAFLDDVAIYNLAPCTSTPTAGTITPGGTQSVCPGTTVNLSLNGFSIAGNVNYQWIYSINGGTSWNNAPGGFGVGNTSYTTPPINQPIRYALVATCVNTGQTDTSTRAIFTLSAPAPVYATLPFNESFESWINGCSTTDLPSASWTNQPKTTDLSWRREDQGASASWNTPTAGILNPQFKVGAHSARLHTAYGTPLTEGVLSAFVNCSLLPGTKELQFWEQLSNNASYPNDSLFVDISQDGGLTWNALGKYGPGTGTWEFKTISFTSNTATTVIRWRGKQYYSYAGGYPDIYLDGVKILPPCTATPVAGRIDSVTACAGQNFTLSLTGTSASAGLVYTWQYKPVGSTGWLPLAGGNVARPTANISVATQFRAIVNCSVSTLSDTSQPFTVQLKPFYYCYCGATVSPSYVTYNYVETGNVTLKSFLSGATLLNNGVATPAASNPAANQFGYEDFRYTVAAPTLIQDSVYRIAVAQTGFSSFQTGTYGGAWIDWDHDGVFNNSRLSPTNPGGELVLNKSIPSAANPIATDTFRVPLTAPVGLTGMRVVTQYYTPVNPCGTTPYYGQYEDYLIRVDYQPCNGKVNAGNALISDTSVCPGYTVDLTDTTYEKKRTGIRRIWQTSVNGGASWTSITGSFDKDTLNNVVVTASSYGTQYRLRAICGNTNDTSFSNTLNVSNPAPVRCYPYASASLGSAASDSSDIGTFIIGPYVNPLASQPVGPHLLNPLANRRRTDYTLIPGMYLAADSTYRLSIYHTMRGINHADAMVSVFIDFNRDGKYDVASPGYPFPSELVYRGITRANNFYLDTFVTMPSTLIPNVPTGLRVVLNNDLNPFGAGNTGVGAFASGEVEDYVVVLSRSNVGVGGPGGLLQNLSLYPNPSGDGKATVAFESAKPVGHLDVVVTTIAGQQVQRRSFEGIGTSFSTALDLSREAKGVYFVELRTESGDRVTRKLIIR